MRRPRFASALVTLLAAVAVATWPSATAGAAGSWPWPVEGAVIRPFDAPTSPYGTGHRGIDIAAPVGSVVRAPAPGVVAFAGPVGGDLFVTLDHGAGLESTYSWLSVASVRRGDVVGTGAPLALSGGGHAGVTPAHLHLGVRLDDVYVDPLDYLGPGSVVGLIRLAPLEPAA